MYKTLHIFARGLVRKSKLLAPKYHICRNTYSTTKKMESAQKLLDTSIVWMDLEMTGLNVISDKIIEVACLITDRDLNILTEGLNFAIKYPNETFEQMDEWCKKHHGQSGLIKKCLESDIAPDRAESLVLEYLQKYIPKGKCPLAGNTIYMDRLFLRQQMPTVDDYLHYRIIDVSSIKEVCRRWRPDVANAAPKKRLLHRSLDDIQESIDELKYYRDHFFKS